MDKIKKMLLFKVPAQGQTFELLELPRESGGSPETGGTVDSRPGAVVGKRTRQKRAPRKPRQNAKGGEGGRGRQPEERPEPAGSQGGVDGGKGSRQSSTPGGDNQDQSTDDSQDIPLPGEVGVSPRLEENVAYLQKIFNWPKDSSIIFREFTIGLEPAVRSVAVYIEGLTDSDRQAEDIFKPLMMGSHAVPLGASGTLLTALQRQLLPSNSVVIIEQMTDVIENVCSGSTVLFFSGVPRALSVETAGWRHRGVEQPTSERVVRGPQEAFNEDLMSNVSLVRRLIRDPKLNREMLVVGRRTRSEVAIMYISDLANPRLVDEVRRRLQSLDLDGILSMGQLEQYIEDESRAVYPLSQSSERVDRVCQALLEGRVAVFIEGDPFVAVFPQTVWGLLHTSEDYNLRGIPAAMLRMIRWLSALLVILLPGFYIAVMTYHHEMIPTDLLLSIAASRERVPFPTVVEVLLMEIAFELIREGGVRIPGVIGPTLGIVGAIILGQAAVAANIVSPVVIIIVAL
ncbi:MAG: spore germination protein, partial [Syntrophomonadaceae bacterium]|nr:spore germination protein [Syntrophomonadaceae bacterium]